MKNHSAKLNKKTTRYRTPSPFKAGARGKTQLQPKVNLPRKENNDWYNRFGK